MRRFFVALAVTLLIGAPTHCAALTAHEDGFAGTARESLLIVSPDEPESTASPDSTAADPRRIPVEDRVVVSYFHRTLRCDTCLKFESYSEEALRASFPGELTDGRVVWQVINLDYEENAHYEYEYDLFESSLIVALESAGDVIEWKKLEDIWGLVHDEPMFRDYVAFETEKSLEALSSDEREDAAPADPVPVDKALVPESDGGGVDPGAQG
jgi:hypothetical protein